MGRRSSNYPPELRERAVRMVAQVRPEYPSDWPAICAVASRLGIGSAETLRKWVRQAEVDAGLKPGTSSSDGEEIARLRKQLREVTEERDILARAVGFFAKGTR